MNLTITRQFEKDTIRELDKPAQRQLKIILEELQDATSLSETPGVKKLKNFPNAYRLRLGTYRIGFTFEKNTVTLVRVMHRKEIYRYFP